MRRCLLPILAGLLPLLGCDSSNPVAPSGTILAISASPTQISTVGVSLVRVVALKGNGTPVNPGTVVLFSTSLGEIEASLATDDEGQVVASLRGTGRRGTATVTASTGSADSVSVDVLIGFVPTSISIQSTPSSVPETGGELELLALVRDEQGQELVGAGVNFLTDVGTLDSAGTIILTDARGEARDRLAITAGDLDALAGDSFSVQAEVGGGGGGLVTSNATVTVLRLPRADFTFGTNNLTVVFTDTTTGRPTNWFWDFGDGNASTQQNPSHTYSAADTYVVELRATNSLGSDSVSKFVSVSGQ